MNRKSVITFVVEFKTETVNVDIPVDLNALIITFGDYTATIKKSRLARESLMKIIHFRIHPLVFCKIKLNA